MNRVNVLIVGDSQVALGGSASTMWRKWNDASGDARFDITFTGLGRNGSTIEALDLRFGKEVQGINENSGNIPTGPGFVAGALNIVCIMCFANNWISYTTNGQRDAWLVLYKAYCQKWLDMGAIVIGCTALPLGSNYTGNYTNHNDTGAYLNPLIEALVGTYLHACVPLGTDPILAVPYAAAPTNAADSLVYYLDGAHCTSMGNGHIARMYNIVIRNFITAAFGYDEREDGAFGFDGRIINILHNG
jgi:hypothetical protein